MKTKRFIYTAFIFVALALMTACSTDNADPITGGGGQAGKVTVHMTLSTSAPVTSRTATLTWEDGTSAENMKSWVVAFVQNGKVVAFQEKTQVASTNDKQDDVTISGLTKGETYDVYSFANLSAAQLGISEGAMVNFDNDTWQMDGNGFNPEATDSKGIPMSNKQRVTIDVDGKPSIQELWVIRMLAKVTLRFKNPSKTDMVVKSITLNDITQNGNANIMLLPKHKDANNDEVTCEPSLGSGATSDSYTYQLPQEKTIAANTTTYEKSNEISFYVNESKVGKTAGYYIINLNTSAGIKRYALFQDWTTIARNDHHILPISLDDYKVQFDVQAYSAIGMFPSLTDNGTTLSYTCYYPEEEFHISPKVIHLSDNSELAGIDKSKIQWELIAEDGMADAKAAEANALKVFKKLPSWNATTGLFEGEFRGDAAERHSALYRVTIPVSQEKSLVYKIQFTNDLTAFAARKHYTRKFYRYE